MGQSAELQPEQQPAAPEPQTPATPEGQGAPPAEGSSAAPPAPEPAQTPPARDDLHVPYPKFREVQTAYTRERREWTAAQQKYDRQIASMEQELGENKKLARDYRLLEDALAAHPDLLDALQQRMQGKAPGQTSTPAPAALPKEVADRLGKIDAIADEFTRMRTVRAQQEQLHEDRQAFGQLDGGLKKMLTEKGYGEDLLPAARAYVLRRSLDPDMEGAALEDVPYLFNEWYRAQENWFQGRLTALRNGSTAAQRAVPANPGSTNAPVSGKPDSGALDDKTSALMERLLTERAWGGQA